MLGECIVYDYVCKYHYDSPFLYLIPNNLDQVGELYRRINIEIRSSKLIKLATKKSYQQSGGFYFYTSNVNLATFNDGVCLDIVYFIERYSDSKINQLRLTSDGFTQFIEIPYHYFLMHESNEKLLQSTDDLLYNYDIINKFNFTFESIPITAVVQTGGILNKGIASDLKLKAYLVLSFEEQENDEFTIRLSEGVKKVLCFLCYSKYIDLHYIELISEDNSKKSINGRLTMNNKLDEKYKPYHLIHSPYQYLSSQLDKFFNGVVNDIDLYGRHLPNVNDHYMGYDIIRLLNIFSAFENEYNKLPKNIRKRDTSHLDSIREIVISSIKLANKSIKTDLEEEFIDKAIQSINQIDTSFGEIQKIIIAYHHCSINMKSIMEFWMINDIDVPYISKRICKLRDKIVHNNYEDELDDHQVMLDIAFLEWLTQTMLLQRYKINDIDKILKEIY